MAAAKDGRHDDQSDSCHSFSIDLFFIAVVAVAQGDSSYLLRSRWEQDREKDRLYQSDGCSQELADETNVIPQVPGLFVLNRLLLLNPKMS